MLANIFCATYICVIVSTCHGAVLPSAEEQMDLKSPITISTLHIPTLRTTKVTRNVTWKLTINDHNFDLGNDRDYSSSEGIDVVTVKEPKDVNNMDRRFFSEEVVTTPRSGSPLRNSEIQETMSTTSKMSKSSTVSSDTIAFTEASDSSVTVIPLSESNKMKLFGSAENISAMFELPNISDSGNKLKTTAIANIPEYSQFLEINSSHNQTNEESEEVENTFIDEIEEFIFDLNKTFNFNRESDNQDALLETSRVKVITDPITHPHTIVTKLKEVGNELLNAELTESTNSLSDLFSTKEQESSSDKPRTTSTETADRDSVTFELSENDLHNSNFIKTNSETPTSALAKELVENNAMFENTTVAENEMELTTSTDSVIARPDCPPSGICVFWFMAQDTCAVDSHCLGSRICCKIRCSKTCMDV